MLIFIQNRGGNKVLLQQYVVCFKMEDIMQDNYNKLKGKYPKSILLIKSGSFILV